MCVRERERYTELETETYRETEPDRQDRQRNNNEPVIWKLQDRERPDYQNKEAEAGKTQLP